MRDLSLFGAFRRSDLELRVFGAIGDGGNGVFVVKSCVDKSDLAVIVSDGGGWDHISVSHERRIPYWDEMEQIKRMFFRDEEAAMQLHVAPKDHINVHNHVLHLWRPNDGREIPLPPKDFV